MEAGSPPVLVLPRSSGCSRRNWDRALDRKLWGLGLWGRGARSLEPALGGLGSGLSLLGVWGGRVGSA